MQTDAPRVLQMRLVVEAHDYDDAVRFFRDVLGLREEGSFSGPDDAHVAILDARAGHARDREPRPEADDRRGRGRPAGRSRLRVAFEVADSRSATDDLVAAGAELIAPPVETPWRSLNSRLAAPAGLRSRFSRNSSRRAPAP